MCIDFNELSAQVGSHGHEFAPRSLDVAERVAFLVFLTDEGFHCGRSLAVALEFPEHLSLDRGYDSIGLGMLELSELLGSELGAHAGVLGLLQVGQEVLLGLSALIVAVLLGVHSQLEELFVILAVIPAILVHLLAEFGQLVLQQRVRVNGGELASLLFGQLYELGSNLTRHLTALAQNHAPHGIVHIDIATLALLHREQIHQGDVLGVLRERCHQWWIAHARPHIGHLVEEFDEQVINTELGLTLLLADVIDGGADAAKIAHHGPHHAAGQSAGEQQ